MNNNEREEVIPLTLQQEKREERELQDPYHYKRCACAQPEKRFCFNTKK